MKTATAVSLLLTLVAALLAGCAIAGPASIANGRLAYADVINYTSDQELLNLIVRRRYNETASLLSVASVTANIKVRGNVGGEFGIGPHANYDGNLVPLSVGAAYEENPTISYIPLEGEQVLRSLVTPLTVEEGFLLMGAADDSDAAARELYHSINSIENPVGRPTPPDFSRVHELSSMFREAGILEFGRLPAGSPTDARYALVISHYDATHHDDLRRWFDLLEVEGLELDGEDIVLPIHVSPRRPDEAAINIQMRSALDLVRHAGFLIDLPDEHVESGIVEPLGVVFDDQDRFIHIRSSKQRPASATVAIPFRGWWFYIDASDTRSKRSFWLIKFLVRLRLDLNDNDQQVPVLTVPVG